MPEEFVVVAGTQEIPPGEKKHIQIGDEPILLVNLGGSYFAVEGECPHAFGYLSRGQLYDDEVVCPVHRAAFNVRTGEVLSPPARRGLKVYPVRVEGGDILVGPPENDD